MYLGQISRDVHVSCTRVILSQVLLLLILNYLKINLHRRLSITFAFEARGLVINSSGMDLN